MSVTDVLKKLYDADIKLGIDGDNLKIKAPKGALTEDLRESLRLNKAAIIETLKLADAMPSQVPALSRRENQDEYPLSAAQERLWLITRLEADSSAYNVPFAFRIKGPLHISLLEAAINDVVQRHETLRARFSTLNGQAVQSINQNFEFKLTVEDLTLKASASADIYYLLEKRVADEVVLPFDINCDAMIRGLLLCLANDDYVLLVTMHHIVSDGWSVGILFREIAEFYKSARQQQLSAILPLPIQYADFAQWQQQRLKGGLADKQLAYWKQYLENVSPLELPQDKRRKNIKGYKGKTLTFEFDEELVQDIKHCCESEKITLSMLLSAAYSILLHKHSSQDDIVFGTPVANRNYAEIEELIGFFVNMLVVRSDLSGDLTVKQLLKQVSENAISSYANQDLPFERIVDMLQPERSQNKNPVFQVILSLQSDNSNNTAGQEASPNTLLLTDCEVSAYKINIETTRFDIELHMFERASGISGIWMYDTELFDGSTIESMNESLLLILQQMVQDVAINVADINPVSEAQYDRLYMDFNDVASSYPDDRTVVELFEQQVQKTPAAIAVSYNGKQLTYEELNSRSSQLANYILSHNSQPLPMIGVYLQRDLDMVISLLAIVKTGAAYVPLDIDYPVSRIEYMVDDAGLALILTTSKLQSKLTVSKDRQICLDENINSIDSQKKILDEINTTAEDVAYVIYTSGSTGQPKGVMIPHKGITRLVKNTNFCQVKETDRIAQISNVSFDAATFELWGSLLNGATLVGMNKSVLLNAQLFSDFITSNKISIVFITTALFNLIATDKADSFAGVRVLLFGGNAANPEVVRNVLATAAPEHLLHVYGPTESTTYATWYEVKAVARDATTVAIGQPLANTQVYILDKNLKPVPQGAFGELYIAGDGLARGYLNREKLTAESFVFHSMKNMPEQRLYKTGDIVRFNHDAMIEFVGRKDNQIKLRGFRIEISEIEITLRKLDNIKDAVVMLREDEPGHKRLSAYIVLYEDNDDTQIEARNFLKMHLPEYMVPSTFSVIDKIKLTSNGKFDYRQLPVPDTERHLQSSMVSPQGKLENDVTIVWKKVLDLTEVGAEDNFFDLGGDSFLIVQLHTNLEQTLATEIPITDLFRFSTVRSFAQHLANASSAGDKQQQVQSRASKQRAAMSKRRKFSK